VFCGADSRLYRQARWYQQCGLPARYPSAAGIPSVVIACVVAAGLLVLDEPFDGHQGVGVEAGQGQLTVQLPGLDSPAVAGAFGFVQGGYDGKRRR
jgi:hypothetical protein